MQPSPGPWPRLIIAGTAGNAGKTVVTLGLTLLARESGVPVSVFKKGPDYIDAAWLSWGAGKSARHLDSFLMGWETVAQSFVRHGEPNGLNLVEGNRGLYDGFDTHGTHSTAELAKHLKAPVILVVNATKVTRTVAAVVLGCQKLDPDVRIRGVILNQVSGSRHERIVRQAVEDDCGLPILGAIPRIDEERLLPGRHLGLVTPAEHTGIDVLRENLLALFNGHMDLAGILDIARSAPPLESGPEGGPTNKRPQRATPEGREFRIGYMRDSAFTFYYAENLEALENSGACLLPLSAVSGTAIPGDLDGLYIGGGFPETHASQLGVNHALLESIRVNVARGLPVYAECGGLMLLAQAIHWEGKRYPMAGVLPTEVEVCSKPQGHGYTELLVDRQNPFFAVGTVLRGHEFHYSRLVSRSEGLFTSCAVRRGTGCGVGRDGIIFNNVWASYTHLHALATPVWADAFLSAARRFRFRAAIAPVPGVV